MRFALTFLAALALGGGGALAARVLAATVFPPAPLAPPAAPTRRL